MHYTFETSYFLYAEWLILWNNCCWCLIFLNYFRCDIYLNIFLFNIIYLSVLELLYNYSEKKKKKQFGLLTFRSFLLKIIDFIYLLTHNVYYKLISVCQSWVVNKYPIWHLWNFLDIKVSYYSYHCEYFYIYLTCTLCYNMYICSIFLCGFIDMCVQIILNWSKDRTDFILEMLNPNG